ncbi:MAG TPA: hypothetical protein PKH33_04030 [bacterium]|nr:hypothetical protein [bacterium]
MSENKTESASGISSPTKPPLFGWYKPQYLYDICEARGGIGQLFLYYSVLAGLKPALDEWIPTERLPRYLKVCEKYGLLTEIESIFYNEASDEVRDSIGGEFLTTTVACGAPAGSGYSGRAHIYVSKSEEALDRIKRTGWYPISVNRRIVTKPQIDYMWFGEHLGYPKCCIDYFSRVNNHSLYPNTLLLPFKNTKSKPNYLCNSLVKDAYCYLYHIPCGFDCRATAELSAELRAFIQKHDRGYADYIDRHMKLNFIVFRERDIYAFDGVPEGNVLKYNVTAFVDSYLYPGELLNVFAHNDTLAIHEDKIFVMSGGKITNTIHKTERAEWFFISFADDNTI